MMSQLQHTPLPPATTFRGAAPGGYWEWQEICEHLNLWKIVDNSEHLWTIAHAPVKNE